MVYAAIFTLLIIRAALDFFAVLKPNIIWDVLYAILMIVLGVVMLYNDKSYADLTSGGWIAIGIGFVWGTVACLMWAIGKYKNKNT